VTTNQALYFLKAIREKRYRGKCSRQSETKSKEMRAKNDVRNDGRTYRKATKRRPASVGFRGAIELNPTRTNLPDSQLL
jgi:hypothetical protein